MRTSSTMSSCLTSVLKKLDGMEEFGSLTKTQKLQRAEELINPSELWKVYFSGSVLDSARDCIEAGLDAELHPVDVSSGSKFHLKLQLKPIVYSGHYGLQGQVTSLLLRNYGSLHASLLVGDAIVLEWNTSGLVIPTGKPIPSVVRPTGVKTLLSSPNDVIEHEFEATIAKKELVDKIISFIVQYNTMCFFDPIMRNCQTFVSDVLKKLDYPPHPKLEGNLVPYYDQLKKSQKKKVKEFHTHAELDAHVQDCLERDLPTATLEYLLVLYFRFHMISLTECERPDRWSCEHDNCRLMPRLEQRINITDTLAYQLLH